VKSAAEQGSPFSNCITVDADTSTNETFRAHRDGTSVPGRCLEKESCWLLKSNQSRRWAPTAPPQGDHPGPAEGATKFVTEPSKKGGSRG